MILPFTRHTWQWDARGLRWHGALRSTSMRWPEIVRLGKSWDGGFFAADKTGRRISWSTYTLGHEALLRAIHTARPDLILPGYERSERTSASTFVGSKSGNRWQFCTIPPGVKLDKTQGGEMACGIPGVRKRAQHFEIAPM
jgi:hypothetical protein